MALPAVAVVLVSGVLGVQLANGGGQSAPSKTANPCAVRTVNSVSTGIEALAERLVILGLDGAACHLHVSREALTLQLAQQGTPTDAQVNALRAGLLAGGGPDEGQRDPSAGVRPRRRSTGRIEPQRVPQGRDPRCCPTR